MEKFKYQWDYTKTMMMKLFMAYPDGKGGSNILVDCERALEIIRVADTLTQGVQKIIYLVGWQYNGHDDKYPDFFEVNAGIKRQADATPLESLLWLMESAKQYNTTVSLHINFNDIYPNAPSYKKYKAGGAIICGKNGEPDPIETYNGLPCYKTDFKGEWESGLFKERIDRLFSILPIQQAKTVHVDNFQCYYNLSPKTGIREMQEYRRKMIGYVAGLGVDITSEFTYREGLLTRYKYGTLARQICTYLYKNDCLGCIPAVWHLSNVRRSELVKHQPREYGGGMFSKKKFRDNLYGNMQAEGIWREEGDWTEEFLYQYATMQVPYHYLCQFDRLKIRGLLRAEKCFFSGNIVTYRKNRRIVKDGIVMKENDDLLLPLAHKKDEYFAYSRLGCGREWQLAEKGYKAAGIYEITKDGNVFLEDRPVKDDRIALEIKPKQALVVCFSR